MLDFRWHRGQCTVQLNDDDGFNTFFTHLQVQRLRRRDFRGCELLALLHELARCGSPGMQSCMQRLLWHCNQVLLKQLTSW